MQNSTVHHLSPPLGNVPAQWLT